MYHHMCSHRISSPLPRHHLCTSVRQSNMAAIYTHWVRWKLRLLSLRPRSPKRMGKKTGKAGKRPINFYIPSRLMLSCGKRTSVRWNLQLYGVCERVPQKHTVTNTAVQVFDVRGAVSVVHVCPLKSFPALEVKTRKQREATYSKVSNDTRGPSCWRRGGDTAGSQLSCRTG